MGEAKRRGTRDERVAAAQKRNNSIAKKYGLKIAELTRTQIHRMGCQFAKMPKALQREALGEDNESRN